jgi:tripartite-type tricarboxylate transporter receptor subunit TctC
MNRGFSASPGTFRKFVVVSIALVALAPLGSAAPAVAQEGKQVRMVIGFGPGGGYDRWGRNLARFIGKHLPGNPNVVPQNMPGAGSIVALNWLSSVAPRDGTVMAIVARDAPLQPLSGMTQARFDPLKLSWIGTPTTETNVCIVNQNAPAQSVADLLKSEVLMGDTGPGTGTHTYPIVLRELLGYKFKLIAGYPSSTDVFIAMERGEAHGICESLDSVTGKKPTWIRDKTVTILFQAGDKPDPKIPDVPSIYDFARNEEQKRALRYLYAGQGIGRPFVAPPGVPAETLKTLRDAFNKTMKDPEFIADAQKQQLDLEPRTGEELEALVKEIYATPKEIIDKVGRLIKK